MHEITPFDIRVVVGERGIAVAPPERGFGTPQNLHVLLRHRLLLQPHGFEGVGRAAKPLRVSDLTVPHRIHDPEQLVEFDSRATC